MKSRLTAALVFLLYAGVALVFGVGHTHGHEAGLAHENCAACSWQMFSVADVPEVGVVAVARTFELVIAAAATAFVPDVSFLVSASRAPPAA